MSAPSLPDGIRRRRAGRGFSYWTPQGVHVTAPGELDRISSLSVPPAWTEVRISQDPEAPLQAVGIDHAGRVQYLYHADWREQQEREKFERMLRFSRTLPRIRRRVTRELRGSDERARAVSLCVRLIDTLALRVGDAQYTQENGSYGVSTLQRRHVHVLEDRVCLTFRGKSGTSWDVQTRDPQVRDFFSGRPRTPARAAAVAWPEAVGRRKTWHAVSAGEINAYIQEVCGDDFTAKDFRTWHGTRCAARTLAKASRRVASAEEATALAVAAAAEVLHNTPAVARASYVDPRLLIAYEGDPGSWPQKPPSDRWIRELLAR